jgi:haloalkane dehalogenase
MFTSEMPFVRTDDSRFEELPNWPYQSTYIDRLKDFQKLRMAYIDEPPTALANGRIALCLHGQPTWSYLYRKMFDPLRAAGYRVIAPDLFGFGRSDKPTVDAWYSFATHRASLIAFIEQLDLKRITLIVQDWGGLLGLTLPHQMPDRFQQLLVMNTTLGTGDTPLSKGFLDWRAYMASQTGYFDCGKLFSRACPELSAAEAAAYNSPFADSQSQAGVRRFPQLVPEFFDSAGAATSRIARNFWTHDWQGQSFMAIGMTDPVLGPAVMQALKKQIRACPMPMEIPNGGHFLQEWEHPSQSIVASALASWR